MIQRLSVASRPVTSRFRVTSRRRVTSRLGALALLIACGAGWTPAAASAGVVQSQATTLVVRAASDAAVIETAEAWVWPVDRPRLAEPFRAPPHRYGAGHRGIDLGTVDGVVDDVRAPASGTIAFVGSVAGRPLLTIDHGDGLVTTLEPVSSDLRSGDHVERGTVVGSAAIGGHTEPGLVHFGVRLHGEYINPLLLLGGIPRAVLVPCCDEIPAPT